jgi:hypothetical protein
MRSSGKVAMDKYVPQHRATSNLDALAQTSETVTWVLDPCQATRTSSYIYPSSITWTPTQPEK